MGKRRDILWLVALLVVAALLFRPAPPPQVETPTPALAPTAVPENTPQVETPTPALAPTVVFENTKREVSVPFKEVKLTGLWTLDQFVEAARTQDPELASRARDVWKKLGKGPEPSALQGKPTFRRGDLEEMTDDSFVVVDGNVQASFLRNSVIIATGRVTVAHSSNSLVICGRRADIAHDGSQSDPSVVLTGDFAEISHATGSVIAARKGLDLGGVHEPVMVINTDLLGATKNVVRWESPDWPWTSRLAPAPPLVGNALAQIPRDLPVHAVVVYESGLADHTVTVEVTGGPAVLALNSYEEVVWKVKGDVRGVVVGGYHPSTIEGLAKGVPLVCRWGGDFFLYDEHDTKAKASEAVQALLGVKPVSVSEEYGGKRFRI